MKSSNAAGVPLPGRVHLEEVVADLVADRKRLEYVSLQAEDERQQALHCLRSRTGKELQRRKEEILLSRNEAQETVVRTNVKHSEF